MVTGLNRKEHDVYKLVTRRARSIRSMKNGLEREAG